VIWPILSFVVALLIGHLTGWVRYKKALAKAATLIEEAGGLVRWLSNAVADDGVSTIEWDEGFEKLKKLIGVIKA
jgi:hypothetical protein